MKPYNTKDNQTNYKEYRVFEAEKKVKYIKGFYAHIFLYVIVNLAWLAVLFFSNDMSSYTKYGFWGMGYGHIAMLVLWGIALVAHGLFVFGKSIPISKKWEDKKIKELLNKNEKRWE